MMPCKPGDGDCQEKESGDCTGIVTGHGTGGRSLYQGSSGLTGTAGWVMVKGLRQTAVESVEGGSVPALPRVVEEGGHCWTSSQVGASLVLGDDRPARWHCARPFRV